MRVLLLSHYFEPENGAPQRRWRALIEHFSEQGVEVDVITPEPHHPSGRSIARGDSALKAGNSSLGDHGGRVHRVSFLPHDGGVLRRTIDHLWVAAMTIVRAERLIRSGRIHPDVVVATAPALPTLIAGKWVAKRHQLPLVVEMRDAWPDLVSHTPGLVSARSIKASLKLRIHRSITALQRSAAALVTTTGSFADILRARGVQNVWVIRNGTHSELYEAIGPAVDDHRELRVLYMGTVGRSQGLDSVVKAAARARQQKTAVRVRIIGDGADQARLRELNNRLGRPVDLRAAVAPGEVLDHYRWADTCVVALRDWGPFLWTVPSKLYELMATGRHVTAVLDGEGADIVRATDSGAVVSPGDSEALAAAWIELANDRSLLHTGTRGQEWVRSNANFGELGAQYLEALSQVVDQHGERG